MADEVELAMRECIAARSAAAAPLVFAQAAFEAANNRTEAQFQANLAAVGGWAAARTALLLASTLYGATAKAIALFHNPNATEIGTDEEQSARKLMEQECKFRIANIVNKPPEAVTVADGQVCN
jgi:hypothetical protein